MLFCSRYLGVCIPIFELNRFVLLTFASQVIDLYLDYPHTGNARYKYFQNNHVSYPYLNSYLLFDMEDNLVMYFCLAVNIYKYLCSGNIRNLEESALPLITAFS